MRRWIWMIALLPAGCFAWEATAADHAIAVYKQGDYKQAIPLLEACLKDAPKDIVLRSDLLSALVYEGRLEAATDAADTGETDFPDAPEMLAARGEYAFYIADIGEAQKLFKRAIQIKEQTARADFGLSRIAQMASSYHSARMLCMRAHEIDPDDAWITQRFLGYVPREKREPQLSEFIAAHPWFYKDVQTFRKTEDEIKQELAGKKAYEPDGERKETSVKLLTMSAGPNHPYGVGVEFRINDGRILRLLLDTGASGILLTQKAVDKAELDHLGSFKSWGIGDEGKRETFAAVADRCEVGTLQFKRCVVNALSGKRSIGPDEDGLIGADFFDDYLIQIDFQRKSMHLTPFPERPPNPAGYDRTVPPEEKDFVPVLRRGMHLYIPTKLNDANWGLFLLDTGAMMSNVDSEFARMSTKIHGDYHMHVRGISGEVKNVFEADKAMLQFAHFRQNNLGLTAFDLNNQPDHQEFRTSGILGISVLSMFRLSIDYRNGLVKFDYIFENKPKKRG
jgi:tetratricopeptide (TPR) repeat protein